MDEVKWLANMDADNRVCHLWRDGWDVTDDGSTDNFITPICDDCDRIYDEDALEEDSSVALCANCAKIIVEWHNGCSESHAKLADDLRVIRDQAYLLLQELKALQGENESPREEALEGMVKHALRYMGLRDSRFDLR